MTSNAVAARPNPSAHLHEAHEQHFVAAKPTGKFSPDAEN
jgi:hypothetical protein